VEPDNGNFEVVRVISEFRLLDAESCEHTYWRRDGKGLAAGWYFVNWPRGTVARRFNEDALFRGPFKLRDEAQAAVAVECSRLRLRAAVTQRSANSAPAVQVPSGAERVPAPERGRERPRP